MCVGNTLYCAFGKTEKKIPSRERNQSLANGKSQSSFAPGLFCFPSEGLCRLYIDLLSLSVKLRLPRLTRRSIVSIGISLLCLQKTQTQQPFPSLSEDRAFFEAFKGVKRSLGGRSLSFMFHKMTLRADQRIPRHAATYFVIH